MTPKDIALLQRLVALKRMKAEADLAKVRAAAARRDAERAALLQERLSEPAFDAGEASASDFAALARRDAWRVAKTADLRQADADAAPGLEAARTGAARATAHADALGRIAERILKKARQTEERRAEQDQ